ncbi:MULTISPECIES: type II toxin-antitoxin system RelE/ParE family toxin [Flavobacterium]|uniref:Type II toxin-antitoxin system RelE/ParE family toxin n=1 Tax=Flavobacterium columnare TaxID=996 RepID=A0AA94F256_9FLAO|nr:MULTISPECIES: type II toxin-antitoxin system RelE/ParE family toxin [Flavobacterium]OXA72766.1 hypothetical protein B0A56_13635 [Flavobacterium columnare NBRC 100251 = ATCC 23463]MCH4828444.1 type II toxin-antitoxin system RelE/ParE family toxin [Flavobacterium columnare]MCH4828452.1 type II toxin-antitoxin system RelE/ParE family toxin [Flavobacterium columnare]MCH4832273.1 type II toxin-antitoxin system RelE/ParE family toxin [Flavobacterium columnare]MCH4832281.1 type II toxin-antitoxin 
MKNFKLVIKSNAQLDLKENINWYNQQKKGLGKTFYSYVKKKAKQLQNYPYSAENRYLEIRTAVVEKFPYMLHYIVDYNNKTIIILAVLHTSKNPDTNYIK